MEFLTLLTNYNDWLDWITGRYDEDKDNEEIGPEPNKFPCFVGEQIVDYSDDDQALLTPVFLYFEDIEKMLEDLS